LEPGLVTENAPFQRPACAIGFPGKDPGQVATDDVTLTGQPGKDRAVPPCNPQDPKAKHDRHEGATSKKQANWYRLFRVSPKARDFAPKEWFQLAPPAG
ncbi:MAG: hypothetical protein RLO10_12970, partial [Roseovarius indicus]